MRVTGYRRVDHICRWHCRRAHLSCASSLSGRGDLFADRSVLIHRRARHSDILRAQVSQRFFGFHRLAKEVALPEVATRSLKRFGTRLSLNHLTDRLQP